MKINFKNIAIHNFMSLGEVNIPLDNRGYTVISGINNNPGDNARSNGSGKSAILEALVWCLTGETIRGNKDVVNCFINNGTCVELLFDVDGKEYKLIRSKDDPRYKTSLLIYINGEDKSGKGIRDSDKLLKEYLPDLTSSLIGSVIILGQGLPSRFTNNSPSGRKEVLEKLCKSDFMVEDLKQRINTRKNALQSILRTGEDNLLAYKTKLNMAQMSLQNTKDSLQGLENDSNFDKILSDLDGRLTELSNSSIKYNNSISSIKKDIEDIHNDEQRINLQLNNKLQEIDIEFEATIDSAYKQKNLIQIDVRTLENEINNIKCIKDVCPTCGQKIPDVVKPDTTDLENKLALKKNELQLLEDTYTNLIKQKREKIAKCNNDFKSMLVGVKLKLTTKQEALALFETNKSDCDRQIVDVKTSIAKITADKQNHQKNIERLKQQILENEQLITALDKDILYSNNVIDDTNNRLSIISKFNTVITRDFRGYLLQSIIEYINLKAKIYSMEIFNTDLVNFVLDGNNISISYNGKQYEALSGGEKQKLDLIIQFSIRDMLCKYTNFNTNIICLDEIFDNLDDLGSQRVIDLISNKLNDISSVFIISHHSSELNIPRDDELIIVKNSNGVSNLK